DCVMWVRLASRVNWTYSSAYRLARSAACAGSELIPMTDMALTLELAGRKRTWPLIWPSRRAFTRSAILADDSMTKISPASVLSFVANRFEPTDIGALADNDVLPRSTMMRLLAS